MHPSQKVAEDLASKGRYGDSMLVHMNPVEVQAMHENSPGGLTINPETGQPEAFLPMLGALAGGWLGGSALGYGAAGAAIGAGLGSFGGSIVQGDSLIDGLMTGLASGASAGLMHGILGAGEGALAADAMPDVIPGSDALTSWGRLSGPGAGMGAGSGFDPTAGLGDVGGSAYGALGTASPYASTPATSLNNLLDPSVSSSSFLGGTGLTPTPAPTFGSAMEVLPPTGTGIGDIYPPTELQKRVMSQPLYATPKPAGGTGTYQPLPATPNPTQLSSVATPGDYSRSLDAGQQAVSNVGFMDKAKAGFGAYDFSPTAGDNPYLYGAGAAGLLGGGLEGYAAKPPGVPDLSGGDANPEYQNEQFPFLRTYAGAPAGYRGGFDPEHKYFTPSITRPRNTAAQGGIVRGYAAGGSIKTGGAKSAAQAMRAKTVEDAALQRAKMSAFGGLGGIDIRGGLGSLLSQRGIDPNAVAQQLGIRSFAIGSGLKPLAPVSIIPDIGGDDDDAASGPSGLGSAGVGSGEGEEDGNSGTAVGNMSGFSGNQTSVTGTPLSQAALTALSFAPVVGPFATAASLGIGMSNKAAVDNARQIADLPPIELSIVDRVAMNLNPNIARGHVDEAAKTLAEPENVFNPEEYGMRDMSLAEAAVAAENDDDFGQPQPYGPLGVGPATSSIGTAPAAAAAAAAAAAVDTTPTQSGGGVGGDDDAASGPSGVGSAGVGSGEGEGDAYAQGGELDIPGQPNPIVAGAIAAITGQHPQPQQAVQAFIQVYGQQAFTALRQTVIADASTDQRADAGIASLVQGAGDGLSDDVPANIEGQEPVALSDGEVVIPADVVSGLGNGSSEAGAEQLEQLNKNVRQQRTGTERQPGPVNAQQLMAAAG